MRPVTSVLRIAGKTPDFREQFLIWHSIGRCAVIVFFSNDVLSGSREHDFDGPLLLFFEFSSIYLMKIIYCWKRKSQHVYIIGINNKLRLCSIMDSLHDFVNFADEKF